jgi:hypothetical protein
MQAMTQRAAFVEALAVGEIGCKGREAEQQHGCGNHSYEHFF